MTYYVYLVECDEILVSLYEIRHLSLICIVWAESAHEAAIIATGVEDARDKQESKGST